MWKKLNQFLLESGIAPAIVLLWFGVLGVVIFRLLKGLGDLIGAW